MFRPRKRTCLDCGFLTIDGNEVSPADRIILSTPGIPQNGLITSILQVNPGSTNCAKHLWTGQVLEEINLPREQCRGFFRYEPGHNPTKHLELQEQRRREKLSWKIALLGIFGGVLGSFLRDIPRWIATLWKFIASR